MDNYPKILANNFNSNMEEEEEEEEEESAFIEMDPSLSPSKRFSNVNRHDFNFAISDQEELIMKNNMAEPSNSDEQVLHKVGIFQKLLDFLKKMSFGCKSGTSTKVVEGPMLMKKWESSEGTSLTPRTSIANYSEEDWRRSCDSEASIYEAVLHCKRTINGDE
ncbi:hypothetical protein KY284_027002 [Solanum tuberosum]|nr:hypothetical protein KY284_027002 [Solanum tuberosum]